MTDKRATRPSTVTLPPVPPTGVITLLEFFAIRFPRVPPATWRDRFAAQKVWTADRALGADEPFQPGLVAHYRREVEHEPAVRMDWNVIWKDEHLVVVDKPPFLPVTPGGPWVRHCLLHLVGEALNEDDLAPLHRIDRLTSGVVVLSRNRHSRSHFSRLFQGPQPALEKRYTAVVEVGRRPLPACLSITNHIARSHDQYWRQEVVPGRPVNAVSHLELMTIAGNLAVYSVTLVTGRKHQIRVQLADAGFPIANDPIYGSDCRHDPEDLTRRMGLDAGELCVSGFAAFEGEPPMHKSWLSGRDGARLLAEVIGPQYEGPLYRD
ncbi:MAG: hypothetical protein K8R59_03425 [Thermoanaerobaculales bacterium]|nr:hypothetical protein [Thermoanaerobaculales bacterium]